MLSRPMTKSFLAPQPDATPAMINASKLAHAA
jgi:hypothetical protein